MFPRHPPHPPTTLPTTVPSSTATSRPSSWWAMSCSSSASVSVGLGMAPARCHSASTTGHSAMRQDLITIIHALLLIGVCARPGPPVSYEEPLREETHGDQA